MEKSEPSSCDGGDGKCCSHLDNSPAVPQKVKKLPCDPATALLGMHTTKRMDNICSYNNLYINVHSSIFLTVKKKKESKWPSSDEQINKMQSSRAMEYYLVMRRNEVLIHATYDIDES